MDEDDMYEINDHLSALATWFFQFIKGREAEIPREDWMKLATHFERLEALFAQEGTPVYPNPIKSRWLTGKDESRQGNRAPAEALLPSRLAPKPVTERLVASSRVKLRMKVCLQANRSA